MVEQQTFFFFFFFFSKSRFTEYKPAIHARQVADNHLEAPVFSSILLLFQQRRIQKEEQAGMSKDDGIANTKRMCQNKPPAPSD